MRQESPHTRSDLASDNEPLIFDREGRHDSAHSLRYYDHISSFHAVIHRAIPGTSVSPQEHRAASPDNPSDSQAVTLEDCRQGGVVTALLSLKEPTDR